MNTTRLGIQLTLRYLCCILMCFIIFLSFTAVFTLASTEPIGYDAYLYDKNRGVTEILYRHYYADGEDLHKAIYEAQNVNFIISEFRSDFTGPIAVFSFSAAQLISLFLFFALVPYKPYKTGLLDFEQSLPQPFNHGVLPGLFPTILGLLSFSCLLLDKCGKLSNGLSLFRFSTYHFYGIQRFILGAGNSCQDYTWLQILSAGLLPAAVTLCSCTIAYHIGKCGKHPLKALFLKVKYKET